MRSPAAAAAVSEPHHHHHSHAGGSTSSPHDTANFDHNQRGSLGAVRGPGGPASSNTSAPIAGGPSHKRGPSSDGLSPGSSTASPSASHNHSFAAGTSAAEDQRTKKRRTGPGSRGVANLTPEQLAKKRANDREAQRAIRERTKNQIEALEKRIQDLTSQQPYQELQTVIRAKEAVEAENAELKQRMSSIVSLIQPILGGHQAEGLFPSPASNYATQPPIQRHPSQAELSADYCKSSPAVSNASPVSVEPSLHSGGALSVASSSHRSPTAIQAEMINQQQHDLHNNLQLGSGEHLKLDFLLDPSQQVHRVHPVMNGAQDHTKYDYRGVPIPEHHTSASTATIAHRHPPTSHNSQQPHHSARLEYAPAGANGALLEATQWAGAHSTPIKNSRPTCPLDNLLLDFLAERRQRAAEGVPAQDIVGPKYPSVGSLLNTASSAYAHPLSKVFTDILNTFPGICTLPERVGVLYIMFLIMRWQVDPTEENYELLPPWVRPTPGQLNSPHPAWIDHIPFPMMREKIAREYDGTYAFENYFIAFTTTISLNWPYEATDTLLCQPAMTDSGASGTSEYLINPVFERHLRRNENWSLGELFDHHFPQLRGTYNLKHDGSAPTNASGPRKSAEQTHADSITHR